MKDKCEEELTWGVRPCPEPAEVGQSSAESGRRLRRRVQTTPRCDWLCLCLYCSSPISPAVDREEK